jgi:D-3-phosphoglycerate dehydrogenase
MENKSTSYPKDKINVLFLENISDAAVNHFKNSGYTSVRKLKGALSEEELIKEIKDVHLLGIRSKTQITKKVIDAAKNSRLLAVSV